MKKLVTLVLVFTLILTFAGCDSSDRRRRHSDRSEKNSISTTVDRTPTSPFPGNNQDPDVDVNTDNNQWPDVNGDPDNQPYPEVNDDPVTLSDPEIVWWHVVTETGIPTFVAEFKNNNSVAVDFTFCVDYFKGSEPLTTSQDNYATGVAPGESIMIWDTWSIPSDADNIDVTYTYLEKSMYQPVPVKLVKEEPFDGGVHVAYSADGNFDACDIGAVFFYGDHAVAIQAASFFGGEDLVADLGSLEPFDSYVLYTNCYVYPQ